MSADRYSPVKTDEVRNMPRHLTLAHYPAQQRIPNLQQTFLSRHRLWQSPHRTRLLGCPL